MNAPTLGRLAAIFGMLSLVAVGGANVVVPDMHRTFVLDRGWLTNVEFARVFAIAQAAPGPNVMIAGLLGFRVAGVLGAIVATLAMCGPSAVATIVLGRGWGRVAHRPWMIIVRDGVAPVTVGLTLATGITLAHAAGPGWIPMALAATAAVGAHWSKRPLSMLVVSAILGVAAGA